MLVDAQRRDVDFVSELKLETVIDVILKRFKQFLSRMSSEAYLLPENQALINDIFEKVCSRRIITPPKLKKGFSVMETKIPGVYLSYKVDQLGIKSNFVLSTIDFFPEELQAQIYAKRDDLARV